MALSVSPEGSQYEYYRTIRDGTTISGRTRTYNGSPTRYWTRTMNNIQLEAQRIEPDGSSLMVWPADTSAVPPSSVLLAFCV